MQLYWLVWVKLAAPDFTGNVWGKCSDGKTRRLWYFNGKRI